jgi:hypothetical protein
MTVQRRVHLRISKDDASADEKKSMIGDLIDKQGARNSKDTFFIIYLLLCSMCPSGKCYEMHFQFYAKIQQNTV